MHCQGVAILKSLLRKNVRNHVTGSVCEVEEVTNNSGETKKVFFVKAWFVRILHAGADDADDDDADAAKTSRR